MLTTLTSAALQMHPGWGPGPGFPWLFLVIPLFWIAVFVLLFAFVGRRWRRSSPPWAMAHQAGRSAEATLAQRFANGDIDETEYRARLEVIRTNNPGPGQG
jgi:putative membrane protein